MWLSQVVLYFTQYAPVLDRFGDMRLRDRGAACQVGDAARHAQYPVVGACRPVQACHGAMQQLFAMWLQATMLFDFRAAQVLVRFPLACQLQDKGCRYPRGDGLRAFAGACVPLASMLSELR